MYIHFDPNKIVLPPILRGPRPHDQPSLSPRPSNTLKRKWGAESSVSTKKFLRYQGIIQGEAGNSLRHTTNRGESSNSTSVFKGVESYYVPAKKDEVISFDDMGQLIKTLRDAFQKSQVVDFAGSYCLHEPGVPHKQRVQAITREIWKATGYRFTVKDHPRMKNGHKTRLWCSQDEAHRSKPSKSYERPRFSGDGVAIAKTRYPCRSGLLISSREGVEPDTPYVLVRMHHHFAHEPYSDVVLPPEVTQLIRDDVDPGKTLNITQNDEHPSPESDSESSSFDNKSGGISDLQAGEDPESVSPTFDSEARPTITPEDYQKRMRWHIDIIRDFCDGLEYQLPFNDFRMLEVLEREGAQFLRLVQDCLKKEGRFGVDTEASSTTIHPDINEGGRIVMGCASAAEEL